MSEQEPFLARWSRRKQEVAKSDARDAARESKPERASPDAEADEAQSAAHTARGDGKTGELKKPAFDPASLPPIESIGADTNIRAFLAEGVPAELKRAALRRVWVSDPAIRDFVGLQENDWDFTKPETIPGFGNLAADYDVEGMVRSVFGDPPRLGAAEKPIAAVTGRDPEIPAQAHEESHEQPARAPETAQIESSADDPSPDSGQPEALSQADSSAQPLIVQREADAAMQKGMTQSHGHPARARRPHGGAMPRDFPDHKQDS
jgi:hypothetical protein